MPELRHDPIQKRWVIIAPERGRRPDALTRPREAVPGRFCPFCEGNEDKTPPEILAVRRDGSTRNGPGWRVRVVPTKFPALMVEGNLDPRGIRVYDRMNGLCANEVIIESPQHELQIADSPV